MLPILPARSAGPDEVRAYIVRVLTAQNDANSEAADETASLWRLGRGSELRDASLKTFKSIFGDFTGWYLYRVVHENELEEWQQSTIGVVSFYALIGSVLLAGLLVLRVSVIYARRSPSIELGFKKVSRSMFQVVLLMGLSMMNYGLQTPGYNGPVIALLGLCVAFPAVFAVWITLIPQPVGQGEAKYVLAADK